MSAQSPTGAEEVLRRASDALREMAAVNGAILAALEARGGPDEALSAIAGALAAALGFGAIVIWRRDGSELVAAGRSDVAPAPPDRVRIGAGLVGAAASSTHALLSSRPAPATGPAGAGRGPQEPGRALSQLVAPLMAGGHLLGVLHATSPRADAFDEDDMALLQRVADRLAPALRLLATGPSRRSLWGDGDQASRILAITSHELRAPLTAIRGFAGMLVRDRDRLSREEVDGFLHVIDRQAARLTRLVQDLLVAARSDPGAVPLDPRTVDLPDLLRGVASSAAEAGRRRVRLIVTPGRRRVEIDPDRVEQVLWNLLQNAAAAAPEGSEIRLTAACSDGFVELSVRDEGPGISKEELPMVFEPFHRAGRGAPGRPPGAGLGLFIAGRLVQAMGGRISVATTPGRGSMFTLSLPAARPPISS